MARGAFPRGGVRARLPVMLRRLAADEFDPTDISGLALWLDAADASSTYTTDAGPVTAVSSPLDIAGCALWLDGADSSAASMTLDGTAVGTWRDKSGNGRDVSATGGARPTLTANYQGSLSAVSFDGGDVLYRASGGIPIAPSTTFVVIDETTAVNFAGVLVGTPSSGEDFSSTTGFVTTLHDLVGNAAMVRASNNQAAAGTGLSTSSEAIGTSAYGKRLACFVTSSSTSSVRLAGLASGTPDSAHTASGSSAGILVAGRFLSGAVSASYRFNGKICEIIHYDSALSATDVARVEAYLAQRWGISGVHVPATATSDPVGYWRDKSGNGRHLTQSLAASRPSFLPTGISSKPALNFDGTDDNIWRQPGITSDDLSILLVHQTSFFSGGVTYEFSHQGDTTNAQASNLTGFGNVAGMQVALAGSANYMCDVTRSFTQVDLQGRSGTAGDITANVPVIGTHCVSYSATASSIRKQAWTSGKGAPNSVRFNCGGWSAITLGARRNSLAAGGVTSPSVFLSGRIAEVIAYSRYISDADRRKLELYLARKWNVTLAGAPIVSNPDAQDWIDRVYGNGGSVSTATAAAVNTLCDSLDAASLRDRFYRLNIFAGSNLNACLTPLYLGPTSRGVRYGNTTDTNNAFVGVGTDYAETGATGGLTGNGTSKYLLTGLTPSALPSLATGHLSVYSATGFTGSTIYALVSSLGTGFANNFSIESNRNGAGNLYGAWGEGGSFATLATSAQGSGNGHTLVSRTGSTVLAAYRDGVLRNTSPTSVTPAASSVQFGVFHHSNSGAPLNIAAVRLGGYSIGASMDATQAAAYYAAMQAFQTALTRNV